MADARVPVKVFLSEDEIYDVDDFAYENGISRSAAIRLILTRTLRAERQAKAVAVPVTALTA